jgi:hypothetical protein
MSKLAGPGSSVTAPMRRTVAALAASAAVLIAFAAAGGTRDVSPSKAAMPAPKPDARDLAAREGPNDSPEIAARIFVSSYVSFLYGRRAASAVTPVGAGLYRQLLGAQSTPTPAELARTLIVRDLTVNPDTRATATGSAVVDDGASPPYALSFNLSFSHRGWVVTAVQKGDR